LDTGLVNSILKFADDTKIFGTVNSIEDRNKLQEDLNKVVEWSKKWLMHFNVGKCKVMHLGRSNQEWNYVMNKQRLKVVKEEKDLGVTITDDLNVSAQCGAAYSKANRMLGLIKRTFNSRDQTIMSSLYKSLVRPHLEYCTAAWSPHYVKNRFQLNYVACPFTFVLHVCMLDEITMALN